MESLEDVLVPMELKYCEWCGGLWFRAKDAVEVYCPGCVPQMADMPKPKRKRVVVLAVNSVEELEGCPAELAAVCGKGGTRGGRGRFSGGVDRLRKACNRVIREEK